MCSADHLLSSKGWNNSNWCPLSKSNFYKSLSLWGPFHQRFKTHKSACGKYGICSWKVLNKHVNGLWFSDKSDQWFACYMLTPNRCSTPNEKKTESHKPSIFGNPLIAVIKKVFRRIECPAYKFTIQLSSRNYSQPFVR